jgi:putative endonuclease
VTIGTLKEEAACGFLERTGYTVVERNFRSRSGEIDVVARLGDMLVFVEVRYRKAGSLVGAEESVTCEKARRIRMAVKRYLCVRGIADAVPVRVDLCVVRDQGQLFEIVPGIIEFG